ncbi:MAG: type II secretion system protein [Candidatus Omnitrophica bacterium]|nr:type II secretion system protein [Candidatus Omnitrophota bacterium]
MKNTKNQRGYTPLERGDLSLKNGEAPVREYRNTRKQRRNRFLTGYTIGEVLITVAIVGTLSAMAVPNFMRMKMNTNMELVKQHLRIIGEEMTQISGKTGKFIAQEAWGNGTTPEELSITANLNGMQNKGYTTDQYSTDENRASYQFRTCPQEGMWGISGDKCFLLDPSGIREVQLWEGWNSSDFMVARIWSSRFFTVGNVFGTTKPSKTQVQNWFLWEAALEKKHLDSRRAYTPATGTAMVIEKMDTGLLQVFKSMISDPVFYQGLVAKGVEVAVFPQGAYPLPSWQSQATVFGFKYDSSFDRTKYTNPNVTYRSFKK